MKWVTRADKAATAAACWKEQHPGLSNDVSRSPSGRTDFGVHHALLMLGPNPKPDDVDEIIGNNSWTTEECDGCGECPEAVCSIATVFDDDEDRRVLVCEKCIEKAMETRPGRKSW